MVRATNKEGKAEDIIAWYNQRGEHSENRIKDLKIGFGMERRSNKSGKKPRMDKLRHFRGKIGVY